ncbi:MAG TPA: hypothetical protein VGZ23_11995 [bacterium]|nr:hypothetical protein [bacterium]
MMPPQVGYAALYASQQVPHQVDRPALRPEISLVQELLQSQAGHF